MDNTSIKIDTQVLTKIKLLRKRILTDTELEQSTKVRMFDYGIALGLFLAVDFIETKILKQLENASV